MVFDGTMSGLNNVLFAPWFGLPRVETMTRRLDDGYWCGDNDYGEMFYNFWLHEDLRTLAGIDVTELFREHAEEKEQPIGGRIPP